MANSKFDTPIGTTAIPGDRLLSQSTNSATPRNVLPIDQAPLNPTVNVPLPPNGNSNAIQPIGQQPVNPNADGPTRSVIPQPQRTPLG